MTHGELLEQLTINGFFCSDGRTNPQALKRLKKYPALRAEIARTLPFIPLNASFAQVVHALKNHLTQLPTCPVCNSTLLFDRVLSTYSTTCSPKCGAIYSPAKTFKVRDVTKDATILAKRIASRQSNFRKGQLTVLNDPEWLFEHHVIQLRSIGEISTELGVHYQTVARALKHFGINSPDKQQLRAASNLRKYNVKNVGMLPEVRNKARASDYATRIGGWRSSGEQELLEFICQYVPPEEVRANDQSIISPKELDIYIPTKQLAFEFCGLYWHSDKFKANDNHLQKLNSCASQGIRLITIFEDEWKTRCTQVKQKIESILGVDSRPKIHARRTKVVCINKQTKQQFFNDNHIQGDGPGSISYGLSYEDKLVAAVTFINRGKGIYELNRYATSCRVIGGFSKLLSFFKVNHTWTQLISFADRRWSNGDLYLATGWAIDKILPPDYYWVKHGTRHHKFNFRHKHLPNRLDVYDPSLTENENCKMNGYVKIYNCGLIRFVINNADSKC